MINKTDCEICKKAIKQKYKNYTFWKALAIIFMVISFVFIGLFCFSGNLFVEETYTVENIINGDSDNNTQTNIVESKKTDYMPLVIILGSSILSGGIIYGCYIVAKKKNNT